jgi:hypothetical protein
LSTLPKEISLFDVNGKLPQKITTTNSGYSFGTKAFSPGVYFLTIVSGDKASGLRFIKE